MSLRTTSAWTIRKNKEQRNLTPNQPNHTQNLKEHGEKRKVKTLVNL